MINQAEPPYKVLELEQLLCQLEQRPPMSASDIDNYLTRIQSILTNINTKQSLGILRHINKFNNTTLGKRCCLDIMSYEADALLFKLTRAFLPHVNAHAFLPALYLVRHWFNTPTCSIIIPTRGRLWYLNLLLRTVLDTAQPKDIDITFCVDSDDTDTITYVNGFKNVNVAYKVKINISNRPENFSEVINKAARESKGRFVWTINNDCSLDFGWLTHLERQDHTKPLFFNVDDDQNDSGHCSFPILTRAAVTALNGTLPTEIPTVQADRALWGIFNKYDPNSIVSLKGVKIFHYTPENGKRRPDPIYLRRGRLATKTALTPEEENSYVNLLKSSGKQR